MGPWDMDEPAGWRAEALFKDMAVVASRLSPPPFHPTVLILL